MDKRQKTLFASAVIIVVLVVGLWGVDFQSTLAVSDLTDEHTGQRVYVEGDVKMGTLRAIDNGSTVLFTLTDGNNDIDVSYAEHQPVNLMEGQSVTVTGTILPDHTISAHRLVTECPSKYAAENTTLKSIQ
ncbi:MAG: cytochrome c maturation protein CcmE [Euryarchaeota archaeon]|nr:cytochrome c maturation protein CcmE [Euryarchaeota archaeon]